MWPFSRSRSQSATPSTVLKPATLLVVQSDNYDWPAILAGATLRDARPIAVVQVGWDDIGIHADTYSTSGLCVDVRKLAKTASGAEQQRPFTTQPDLVLVRNEVTTPTFDGRQLLSGLLFADVPAVNSLQSIFMFTDRAAIMGQLHKLHRKLGDAFPMVPQHFASSYRSLMYGATFPAVVKVGSAHAGAGKMRVLDHHQMSDFRSVLQMMPQQHCFVEPFVEGACDLRIQKIGQHVRAFRRVGVSGEWKTNTGTAVMEQVACEERWRRWAEEAAALFGGLDILTVDAIVEEGSGAEHIIEVNGTSSGLHPDCADEDNAHLRDLVLARMNAELCPEEGE